MCSCEIITATVNFCEHCHRYWLGGRELTSVTKVIKDVLPPAYDGVAQDTLEKARERGIVVDALITAYIRGEASANFPQVQFREVLEEAPPLFEKFRVWFEAQKFKKAEAQVIVHDDEIAGTLDLYLDGVVHDVKCTYNVMPSHHIQVAGYWQLGDSGIMRAGYGRVIHLTKRHNVARIMDVSPQSFEDWRTVRNFWSLKRRLQ